MLSIPEVACREGQLPDQAQSTNLLMHEAEIESLACTGQAIISCGQCGGPPVGTQIVGRAPGKPPRLAKKGDGMRELCQERMRTWHPLWHGSRRLLSIQRAHAFAKALIT